MRIVLDAAKCSSLGLCESVAPDFFEVGDDGALVLLRTEGAASERALLQDAVASCPTAALSLQE